LHFVHPLAYTHSLNVCWALNHQNLIKMAQGHIFLSKAHDPLSPTVDPLVVLIRLEFSGNSLFFSLLLFIVLMSRNTNTWLVGGFSWISPKTRGKPTYKVRV
jgi:hypothetical protein